MRVTIKKAAAYKCGIVKWYVYIDGKAPAIMAREADGDLSVTWCDSDFDVCTVKMCRGAALRELKALFKAIGSVS